jgi:hypothetical protein
VTNEEIARAAQAMRLRIDPERAASFEPGLTSLLARVRRLGELLPRETPPPPNQAPR